MNVKKSSQRRDGNEWCCVKQSRYFQYPQRHPLEPYTKCAVVATSTTSTPHLRRHVTLPRSAVLVQWARGRPPRLLARGEKCCSLAYMKMWSGLRNVPPSETLQVTAILTASAYLQPLFKIFLYYITFFYKLFNNSFYILPTSMCWPSSSSLIKIL